MAAPQHVTAACVGLSVRCLAEICLSPWFRRCVVFPDGRRVVRYFLCSPIAADGEHGAGRRAHDALCDAAEEHVGEAPPAVSWPCCAGAWCRPGRPARPAGR